jgi:protein AIR1/2
MPASDDAVIDLALSSPPGPSQAHGPPADSADASAKPKRKKKKKRVSEPVTDAGAGTSGTTREEGEVDEPEGKKKRKRPRAAPSEERTRSLERRRARRSPSLEIDDAALFFVDVARGAAAAAAAAAGTERAAAPAGGTGPGDARSKEPASLLLPGHVSVLPSANGSAVPVQIITEDSASEEDDFIELIQYDDRQVRDPGTCGTCSEAHFRGQVAGMVRYFESQEDDASKAAKIVCKHCGAKGEHKTFECNVLIVSALVADPSDFFYGSAVPHLWFPRRAQYSQLSDQQDVLPLWSQRTCRPGPFISPLSEPYIGTET